LLLSRPRPLALLPPVPYTTLFRSKYDRFMRSFLWVKKMVNTEIKWFSFDNTNAPQFTNTWGCLIDVLDACLVTGFGSQIVSSIEDRKSTRLNSSHVKTSHAVFCLK